MIEIKAKPCKGIGKANGVVGCGTVTKQRTFGLCSNCLHDFLFTTDAGKLEFSKISLQAKKTVIVKEKKKDQELGTYGGDVFAREFVGCVGD